VNTRQSKPSRQPCAKLTDCQIKSHLLQLRSRRAVNRFLTNQRTRTLVFAVKALEEKGEMQAIAGSGDELLENPQVGRLFLGG
jgi:hypothetical protein